MEFVNKIFGIEFNRVNGMLGDNFNKIYCEDENAQFVSKEEFIYEEELNFKYRFIITGDAFWENGKVRRLYMLSLVPTPDSLNAKTLEKILSCCGIEKEHCTYADVYDYGCSIPFGSEMSECDENEDKGWDMNKFEDIANVCPSMQSTIGFQLDKVLNGFGNTGWDYLNDFINGKNIFE